MNKIRAIIFDMGDILFDATQWRKGLHKFLSGLGYDGDFNDMVTRWDKFLKRAHLGKAEYYTVFKDFIASLGYANEYEQIKRFSMKKAMSVEANRKLFPDVKKTLQKLKRQGIKLAILTDSESSEEKNRGRLKKLQINKYFGVVISSADIGYVKPQRRAFQITLERLDVKNTEAAFVGHDSDELKGARRAGLKTIAFNYDPNAPADHLISNFEEILNIPQNNIK